jgi:hypothetical protein
MVVPFARSQVLIDANPAGQAEPGSVVRKDKGQMPSLRDHRIVAITSTLAKTPGMNMHIGHDGHIQIPAFLPDDAELAAVEFDDAMGKARGINIVVKEELLNFSNLPLFGAKEKSAAFTPACSPAPELIDALIPDLRAADQFRRLAGCRAQ